MNRFSATISLWLVALIFVAPGCSKEKMEQLVNDAKVQAEAMTKGSIVAEVIPVTGKSEVQMTPPLKTEEAFARIYSIGDGRPGVVQFTTYDPDKGPNRFPALLIRATTTATTLDELSGQTLMGRVILQASNGGTVLMMPEGASVDIQVATPAPEKKTIDVSIGGLTLLDEKGQPTTVNGITLEGKRP